MSKKVDNQGFEKKFNINWLLAEEIPNICPFFSQIWLNCFVNEFARPGGRVYKKVAAVFKDYHLWFYYDSNDAREVGEHIVNKFFTNLSFMAKVNKNIVIASDKLRVFADKVPETNLDKLTNKKLWDIYKQHEDIHTEYYQWGWLPVAADMLCNNLSDKGKSILVSRI